MVVLSAAGGAYWFLATCPSPFLAPLHSVGGGALHPSASHHLVPSLPGLSLPLYSPFFSPERMCQRSPQTVPVSLVSVGSPGGGQLPFLLARGVQADTPILAVGVTLPNGGLGAPGCPLVGSLPQQGHKPTFSLPCPALMSFLWR